MIFSHHLQQRKDWDIYLHINRVPTIFLFHMAYKQPSDMFPSLSVINLINYIPVADGNQCNCFCEPDSYVKSLLIITIHLGLNSICRPGFINTGVGIDDHIIKIHIDKVYGSFIVLEIRWYCGYPCPDALCRQVITTQNIRDLYFLLKHLNLSCHFSVELYFLIFLKHLSM